MPTIIKRFPGDRRKIEKLYEKYNKLMYCIAFDILKNIEDAEDAVITSWEKIICHLDKIKEVECQETKSFIVIVVERTAIDLYRKNKRNRDRQVLLSDFEDAPFLATKEKSFENIELYQSMRNIPKIYSDTLLLYYINGLSVKEIASLLGVKVNVIENRLSRGRKLLREEMER